MRSEHPPITEKSDKVGLPRYFATIFFDAIVLIGLIFIAAQPFPLIPDSLQNQAPVRLAKQIYLLGIAWFYFCWFWTHHGQTLGMKSWRLRVVAEDGGALSWGQASLRYLVAILSWLPAGLGYWWRLFDREQRTWHDTISRSRLVLLPKEGIKEQE